MLSATNEPCGVFAAPIPKSKNAESELSDFVPPNPPPCIGSNARLISSSKSKLSSKINFSNSQSLYSQETVSLFLKTAKNNKSFEEAFEVIKDGNPDILNLLHELCDIDVDFDKKFDFISSNIKNRKLQNKRFENAITIIDSPIFEENKTIFIPCFAQNIFPKSFKDSGYISDADKEELKILTSLDKCRIENDISKDFLLSNNEFILSRSGASFSEKYFPSPFCKSLEIVEIEIRDIPSTIYSKKYGKYRLGIDLDKKKYFLQHSKCEKSLSSQLDINYRNYDNSYIDADAFEQNKELTLSYTNANKYFKCPFSFDFSMANSISFLYPSKRILPVLSGSIILMRLLR